MFNFLRKKKIVKAVDLTDCAHIYGKWEHPLSSTGVVVQQHQCIVCGWTERTQTQWLYVDKFNETFRKWIMGTLTELKVNFTKPEEKESEE